MDEMKLSEFYSNEKLRSVSVDKLKFWLMPFVYFTLLGFPTRFGGYVSILSNFAAPAFFILCGFLNLVPDSDTRLKKVKKALKRSLIIFLVMLLSYIAINLAYLAFTDSLNSSLASEIFRKRIAFNFLALNIWVPLPMGSSIWFIHSLFYAYVFFFIAERFKLSKLYIPLFVLLCVVMLATGEFAAFLKFPHFGYNYIPSGAITRAIPYMILGMIIRKHIDKIGKINRYWFAALFFAGLALSFAEMTVLYRLGMLIYKGHNIGMGVMAVSVCCYALVNPVVLKRNFYANHGRKYAIRLYAFCQPVSLMIFIVGPFLYPPFIIYFHQFSSLVTFAVSFLIALIIGVIKYTIFSKKKARKF